MDLCFKPDGTTYAQQDDLPFTPIPGCQYASGHLRLSTTYDNGSLATDSGTGIVALRPIRGSTTVELLSDDKQVVQTAFASLGDAIVTLRLDPKGIVPGFNCHGFTFAASMFWINNDQIDSLLAGDGYELVADSIGDILVFRLGGNVVHTVQFDSTTATLRGKSGVRGFTTTTSRDEAMRGIKWDSCKAMAKKV